jgi:alanyl-tRNA synthetase
MLSSKIRKEFLHYFKNKNHKIIPSSPVIPHEDPTLLFTNAGMNQFKDVFLGQSHRDYKRATTAQKCIRAGGKHNDLDNVGHTSRHMTFFEMLGNFSFGDYFKKEAILFAWEVALQVFKFDPEKIWVSVFEEDDEAFELWTSHLPEKRIVRLGKKDNFWMMGETGPCGPCSELLYDRGKAFGSANSPLEDSQGERYLEFWNLVFMQYNAQGDGKMAHLPNKSVDTGAGLERIVSILENVDSVFKIDTFRELTAQIEEVLHVKYDPTHSVLAPAFYVIGDHLRSLSFAIADGAQPSNIERGYVLRKLLRRAVRYGRILGAEQPFLAKIFPRLLAIMGKDYHELDTAKDRICEILTVEEESFFRTLRKGGHLLSSIIGKARLDDKKEICGADAFKLKDTYGFPLEEILLLAKDNHLQVNLDAFELLEAEAKERSKKAKDVHRQEISSSGYSTYLEKYGATEFVGFTENEAETTILAIIKDGKEVQTLEAPAEEVYILLDKTPFYAEKGGQVSDQGELFHEEVRFAVEECQQPLPDLLVHKGRLTQGVLIAGEPVISKIDMARRELIENNHSATHLLHWALQRVLGEHIRQAGSLVEPDKLRFDFTHHKSISREELREIESLINIKIRSNAPVKSYELSYEDVQGKQDVKQFFGEKYGSVVRVVDIADFSKELCGGTHVPALGRLGLCKILKESSIAKGVRRIEAITGKKAELFVQELEDKLSKIEEMLSAPSTQVLDRLHHLMEENHLFKTSLKKYRTLELNSLSETLKTQVHPIGEFHYLHAKVDLLPAELFSFANTLAAKIPNTILLLALEHEGKCQMLLKTSEVHVKKGIHAPELIHHLAPFIEGTGGGKGTSAQAGGANPQGIEQAFKKFKQLLEELC